MKKFMVKVISSIAISMFSISFTINAMDSNIQTNNATSNPIITAVIKENLELLGNNFLNIPDTYNIIQKILELTLESYAKSKNDTLIFQGTINFQIKHSQNTSLPNASITLDYDNSIMQITNNGILREIQYPKRSSYFTDEYKNLLNSIPIPSSIKLTDFIDFINHSITTSITTSQGTSYLKTSYIPPIEQNKIKPYMYCLEKYFCKLTNHGFWVTRMVL